MFNLEQSIADWRKQMLAAGIKSPVPLEELEMHLREEIERQIKPGLSEREIFDSAVQKIGQGDVLKLEFKKVAIPMEVQFVKLMGIASAVIAGLFSLWILFVLLTVHEANLTERTLGLFAVTFIILSWRYGLRVRPVIRNRRARTVISAMCCLASVGGMMLFIKFLPHFLTRAGGSEIPIGHFLVSFLWAWAVMAILGGMAFGFENAARKNAGQYV